jgi:predicted metal-dependent hydrolase
MAIWSVDSGVLRNDGFRRLMIAFHLFSSTFHHLPASAKKVRMELAAEALILHAPELPEASLIRRLKEDLYRRHCRETLLPRLEAWSRRMELFPSRVGFRRARSRWGSCTSCNAISLNIYLVALPPELADYVLVHELAHIGHKNHSRTFWNEVEKYLPDWKTRRKKLREYEGILPPPQR